MTRGAHAATLGGMAPTVGRVADELDALARRGLDPGELIGAAARAIRTVVPFDAACAATTDPDTELVTSVHKVGILAGEGDAEWAHHEYVVPDVYDFREAARRPGGVVTTVLETGGDPARSPRFAELFRPRWGFSDELRAGGRSNGRTWGGIALFRSGGATFTPADVHAVQTLLPAFTRGLRASLVAGAAGAPASVDGPVVLVVDARDTVVQASAGAAVRLQELAVDTAGDAGAGGALPAALRGVLAASRAYAAGRRPRVPSVRLRARSGAWVLAHGAPLVGVDPLAPAGADGLTVVTVEEARPPEIVPLMVAAFGLTPREQAVVRLVLQGLGTAEIAAALCLSAHTVQDHLKVVFERTGVHSRRELAARVFYDQYAPRLADGTAPGPAGGLTRGT